jgi:spore coat polysaccharide biosynthesis protein SpsF
MMHVRAFIQARMSSTRFPGKVLTPFRGCPLIEHVIAAARQAVASGAVLVVTSDDPSDDVLAQAVLARGTAVFRGPLHNVLERFQQASRAFPSDWVLRLTADSPLLDVALLRAVVAHADERVCDLVTTTFPRTFPKGRNAEAIRRSALLAIDAAGAQPEEREHVTRYFYNRADAFRIVNVASNRPQLAELSLAVDCPDDLDRLERLSPAELAAFEARAVV